MNELETRLDTLRNAYAGTTRKAARAWHLIEQLRSKRVLVKVSTAIDTVANNVYYSQRYNACERYECIEDFKESLKEDLDSSHTVEVVAGEPMYVVTPFFDDKADWLHHMGLGYLRGVAGKELQGLNVKPLKPMKSGAISGLSDDEVLVLIGHYRRQTLTLVNLMRKTSTALRYIRTGLENRHNTAPTYPGALKDEDIAGLVQALANEIELPFLPTPAEHFGTDADGRNILRALPEGDALEALLHAA